MTLASSEIKKETTAASNESSDHSEEEAEDWRVDQGGDG